MSTTRWSDEIIRPVDEVLAAYESQQSSVERRLPGIPSRARRVGPG